MSGQDKLAGAMDAGQLERVARHVALKGQAEVARLLAIAERAQAMLADPAFSGSITAAEKVVEAASFPWEAKEAFPVRAPVSLYLASVDDFATGEGLTIHFAAAFARSEAEFRRRLAAELGAGLADRAWVGRDLGAAPPFTPLFLTPALRRALEAFGADDIARNCTGGTMEKRFGSGRWREDASGVPYLADALAAVICRQDRRISHGSHDIVIGEVRSVNVNRISDPLIYADGIYQRLSGKAL